MAETGHDAGGADCRPPVSFELFPPRTDAAALALGRTIDRLAEARPAFISVTFGAGGTSRDRSLTVLRYMLENTDVEPMAHLTCVGSSHAEANRLVREFLDAGRIAVIDMGGTLRAYSSTTVRRAVGSMGQDDGAAGSWRRLVTADIAQYIVDEELYGPEL